MSRHTVVYFANSRGFRTRLLHNFQVLPIRSFESDWQSTRELVVHMQFLKPKSI